MDCSETSTCHVREEACLCLLLYLYIYIETKRTRSKQCLRQTTKAFFHISVRFCWFFMEEGLTSCYKNILIFVTIIEDNSSVRNTAPAKARLECHFNSPSPSSLVSFCLCPCLSLLLTDKQQQMSPNGHVILKAV